MNGLLMNRGKRSLSTLTDHKSPVSQFGCPSTNQCEFLKALLILDRQLSIKDTTFIIQTINSDIISSKYSQKSLDTP